MQTENDQQSDITDVDLDAVTCGEYGVDAITLNGRHSQLQNHNDTLSRSLEKGHETLATYFAVSPCFNILKHGRSKRYSQLEVANSASDAVNALLVLEEFPSLAAKTFSGYHDEHPVYNFGYLPDLPELFPLAFFVFNNFEANILDRIFKLYPEAINQPCGKWSSLLEYACSDSQHMRLPTVKWIASNTAQNCDTAKPILAFFSGGRLEEMSHDETTTTEQNILEILLSKSPRFRIWNKDSEVKKLVDTCVSLTCASLGFESELVLQLVEKLPFEYRVLNLTRSFIYFNSDTIDLVELMLPKLSEIQFFHDDCVEDEEFYFDLDFFYDDHAVASWVRVVGLLAKAMNLRKLSLSIPTEIVCHSQDAIDAVKNLLHQHLQFSATNAHLRLIYCCPGDTGWLFEDEVDGEDSDNDSYCDDRDTFGKARDTVRDMLRAKAIDHPMEFVNNQCIKLLLDSFRTGQGTTNKRSMVEEIVLHDLYNVHLEYLAKLGTHTKSLKLAPTTVKSLTANSHSLCKVWKQPCPNPRSCCGSQGLKDLALLRCYNQSIVVKMATFVTKPLHGQRLVKLRLEGQKSLIRPRKGELRYDVTEDLVSTLGCVTLEQLQFSSAVGHKLQLPLFAAAVKMCRHLKRLELVGLDFRRCDQRSVVEWFLEMIEGSVNKVLEFLLLESEQRYHFINRDAESLFTGAPYSDYIGGEYKVKIQYLLWLARFGWRKMSSDDTKAQELIEVLWNVNSVSFSDLATQVDPRYPRSEQQAEKDKNGVLYGLLREKPSLWCSPSVHTQPSPIRGGNKRKFGQL